MHIAIPREMRDHRPLTRSIVAMPAIFQPGIEKKPGHLQSG